LTVFKKIYYTRNRRHTNNFTTKQTKTVVKLPWSKLTQLVKQAVNKQLNNNKQTISWERNHKQYLARSCLSWANLIHCAAAAEAALYMNVYRSQIFAMIKTPQKLLCGLHAENTHTDSLIERDIVLWLTKWSSLYFTTEWVSTWTVSAECESRQNTLATHLTWLHCGSTDLQDDSYANQRHINTIAAARCLWIWQETTKHMMGKQPWVKIHKHCPEHRCLVWHA